jgi:hypothetical protein
MGEVQVLEATRTVPNGRGRARTESGGLKVERIRVAAYCLYMGVKTLAFR